MFAFSLNFLIPVFFFLFARFRKPWFIRPLAIAAIGGSIFVLFLSFSRGGFLGLAFMFMALVVIERRNKYLITAVIVLLLTGVIVAPAVYWERMSSILHAGASMSEDFSVLSRLETIRISLILGIKNPIFGIGIGNFLFYASRYIAFSDVVHNSLLQIFSDLGLTAMAVILALIFYNFTILKKLIRLRNDPEAAQVGRILFIQHIAVLANSMTMPAAFHLVFWITLLFPTVAWFAYVRQSRLILKDSF